MRIFKHIIAVLIAITITMGAAAQEVVNILYGLKAKTCSPALDTISEGQLSTISTDEILIGLQGKFPIVARRTCDMQKSPIDLIRSRVAPSKSDHDSGTCGLGIKRLNPNLSDLARFADDEEKIDKAPKTNKKPDALKKDDNALRFRRSLLRIFEAAYSGGANDFIVFPKAEAPTDFNVEMQNQIDAGNRTGPVIEWPEFINAYVPRKSNVDDDLLLYLFLKAGADQKPFTVACAPKDKSGRNKVLSLIQNEHLPSGFELNEQESTILVQSANSVFANFSKPHKYKSIDSRLGFSGAGEGAFRLLKDREQFTARKPEGAKIGTEFDLEVSDDQSEVTADAALGYVLTINTKDKSNIDSDGATWNIIPYLEIDQGAAAVAQLDEKNPFFADGTENLSRRNIAFAEIKSGLRLEVEPHGVYCSPINADNNCPRNRRAETIGLRRPANRFILDLSYFTDNYLDIQGVQYEFGYSPAFFAGIPGYRDSSSILGRGYVEEDDRPLNAVSTLSHGRFKWDTTFVLDRLEYARPPKDDTTLDPSDRIDPPDAFRAGLDFEMALQWGNIFALPSDKARLEVGGKYSFREPNESGIATIRNYEAFVRLNDTQNDKLSVEIKYGQGRGNVGLKDKETIGFEIGTKF